MRMKTLLMIKEEISKHIEQPKYTISSSTQQTHHKCISKHKYWSKVSKKNKLQLLIDYINKHYNNELNKNEYCFKITMLLNNGDLNNDDCVVFDHINNCITKLNFSLDTLDFY